LLGATKRKSNKKYKIEKSKVTIEETSKQVKLEERFHECKIETINNFYKEKYVKFLY
jgi:hypothetical protein